jgi:hypothetical protein
MIIITQSHRPRFVCAPLRIILDHSSADCIGICLCLNMLCLLHHHQVYHWIMQPAPTGAERFVSGYAFAADTVKQFTTEQCRLFRSITSFCMPASPE